jgi:acyl-coenzyme A thioesterase PaaI-like protein
MRHMKYEQLLPLQTPESYRDVKPFPDSTRKHSFLSGNPESPVLRVRYFLHEETKQFLARAWFGPGAEGPPGFCHGGSQAALLDEAMGAVVWVAGHTVLAAKIEINFRRSIPLETAVTVTAGIQRIEGKKFFVEGALIGDDGIRYADGTGLFIRVDISELKAPKKA